MYSCYYEVQAIDTSIISRKRQIMKKQKQPMTKQQEDRHYLLIIIGFLIIVGSLVIFIVFGPNALILALPILIGGALILLLPFYLISGLDWLAKKIKDRNNNS